MSEETLPFMPLWVDRFFGGTLKMDGEEQSLYLLLLAHQWATGPLPPDPKRIAKLISYDEKRFLKLWGVVSEKFVEIESGLVNLPLEEVREISEKRAKTNSKRSTKAAEARWSKAKRSARSMPQAMQQGGDKQCLADARDHARLMPSHIPDVGLRGLPRKEA